MVQHSWRRLSRLADTPGLGGFGASGDPFLHPAYLLALETSGAVGPGTAWEPCHLLFLRDETPVALLPLYLKHDSRGEYVFDQAWASAYLRHGLPYYPKLVTAIPFTPVPGPRLLLAPGETLAEWLPVVLAAVKQECLVQDASGWHGLFVSNDWIAPAREAGLALREGCRFHWSNRGYGSFEDFLATLTSKKRKDIRRERRLLAEAGVACRTLTGAAIDAAAWDFFHRCYVRTYHEHGQTPYLNREFFGLIASTLREHLSLVIASDEAGPMASALFLHQGDTLYGRYWGSLRRADGLHFEVCYYQGIELCLRLGLSGFDPGTQGEHKLLRGFAPRLTHSLHWLREPAFRAAIEDFVAAESREVRRYQAAATAALPYRQDPVE
ncbi:MAG: hypothetical protein K0Q68_1377 [Moraxellaceae bacterium]|jgi:predicted N-acyltransferase|nr:hypothetical protein [Moraxellaceae bacterium]